MDIFHLSLEPSFEKIPALRSFCRKLHWANCTNSPNRQWRRIHVKILLRVPLFQRNFSRIYSASYTTMQWHRRTAKSVVAWHYTMFPNWQSTSRSSQGRGSQSRQRHTQSLLNKTTSRLDSKQIFFLVRNPSSSISGFLALQPLSISQKLLGLSSTPALKNVYSSALMKKPSRTGVIAQQLNEFSFLETSLSTKTTCSLRPKT